MSADRRVVRLSAFAFLAACAVVGCGTSTTPTATRSADALAASSPAAAVAPRTTDASLTPAVFDALRNGDMAAVRSLIEKGADANAENDQGVNLFSAVATNANYDDMAFLVAHGAKPNSAAVRAVLTAGEDDPRIVAMLLSVLDKDYQETDLPNHSLLMLAAESGHVRQGAALLKAGASIDLLDSFGDPAVNVSAFHNELRFTQMLVEAGARLDIRGQNDRGCVAHARNAGADAELISYLKSQGAPE